MGFSPALLLMVWTYLIPPLNSSNSASSSLPEAQGIVIRDFLEDNVAGSVQLEALR
jgi:hypothetical protein